MRKINWEQKLSDEDIVWLRAAGHVSEEQIARHQEQFDAKVPDPETPVDETTQSALNPAARANTPAETGDGPVQVDPTQADPQAPVEDDYNNWSVPELKDEVAARNGIQDAGDVEVVGTGKNGAITKSDYIKGLRLWDAENPDTPES